MVAISKCANSKQKTERKQEARVTAAQRKKYARQHTQIARPQRRLVTHEENAHTMRHARKTTASPNSTKNASANSARAPALPRSATSHRDALSTLPGSNGA